MPWALWCPCPVVWPWTVHHRVSGLWPDTVGRSGPGYQSLRAAQYDPKMGSMHWTQSKIFKAKDNPCSHFESVHTHQPVRCHVRVLWFRCSHRPVHTPISWHCTVMSAGTADLCFLPEMSKPSLRTWLMTKVLFASLKSHGAERTTHRWTIQLQDRYSTINSNLFDRSQAFWSHDIDFHTSTLGDNQVQVIWRSEVTCNKVATWKRCHWIKKEREKKSSCMDETTGQIQAFQIQFILLAQLPGPVHPFLLN